MVVHTFEQRWEILRHYIENHGNVAECVRKLRTNFRRREAPPTPYVRYLAKKVKETGNLIDKSKREKPKQRSIHHRPQQLKILEISLTRILHNRPWYESLQSPIGSEVEAN